MANNVSSSAVASGLHPARDSVISRTQAVIETLAERGTLGLAALARRCDLPKTTVYRICTQLCEWGVVIRLERGFALGPRLRELANAVPHSGTLGEVGLPFMTELYVRCRVPAMLTVLDDPLTVRCVANVSSPSDGRRAWVGERASAHCTADGKAILAFSRREIYDAVMSAPLAAYGRYPAGDHARLARDIAEIRVNGFSWHRHAGENGTALVSVPVLDRSGRALGALSLGGRSMVDRWSEAESVEVSRLLPLMQHQARRISSEMEATRQRAIASGHGGAYLGSVLALDLESRAAAI